MDSFLCLLLLEHVVSHIFKCYSLQLEGVEMTGKQQKNLTKKNLNPLDYKNLDFKAPCIS